MGFIWWILISFILGEQIGYKVKLIQPVLLHEQEIKLKRTRATQLLNWAPHSFMIAFACPDQLYKGGKRVRIICIFIGQMSIALVEIVKHFQILGHYVVWSTRAANDELVSLVGFVAKLLLI